MGQALQHSLDWLTLKLRPPQRSLKEDLPNPIPDLDDTSATSSIFHDASAHQAATTFHHFTLLPYELRMQIWILTLSQPQVITPRKAIPRKTKSSKHHQPSPLLFSASSPSPPPAFSICWETRRLALQTPYLFTTGNTRLYLNPKIDTLCFTNSTNKTLDERIRCTPQVFARFAKIPDLRRLKKLVIGDQLLGCLCSEVENPTGGPGEPFFDGPMYRRLSGLEEITVVFEKEGRAEFEAVIRRAEGRRSPHCGLCEGARREVGDVRGWKFPTFREFGEAMRRKGTEVSDEVVEEEYSNLLLKPPSWHFLWESLPVWLWGEIHGVGWQRVFQEFERAIEEFFTD